MVRNIVIDGIDTGYTIDDKGRVCNRRGPIKGGMSKQGYLRVTIRVDGFDRVFLIHRLVAENFVPNDDPKNKVEVHHRDGNKLNNEATNLEWISKHEHGMRSYFENECSQNRYSPETIKNVIKSIAMGMAPMDIAKKFHVSVRLVHDIKNGKTFKDYTEGINLSNYNDKYHRKDRTAERLFVKKLIKNGFPPDIIVNQIMEVFGYDREESAYVYNYLLRDEQKIIPKDKTRASYDARYKYDAYIKDIEQMLLDGVERKNVVKWAMENIGIDFHKADDLIKQRIRALSLGYSMVSTKGRESDVRRIHEAHLQRVNRREELGILNDKIDEMLLSGVNHEEIVNMVRESGLVTGKTGRADNARMKVTQRKFYLKKKGLLKE